MTYCLDSAYLVRGFPNEAQLIAECADLIQANNIQYARHPLAEAQISKRNWRALECATTASSLRLNAGRIRVLQDRALLSKSKSAELYLEELIGSSESKLGDSIDWPCVLACVLYELALFTIGGGVTDTTTSKDTFP